MNGVEDEWPASCLSNVSLVSILFAISPAWLKSSLGNKTQYNLDGSVFLKNSKTCCSP